MDTPEAYIITESNLETLCNIRSRLNAPERLDYDQRRTLAVLLETIIDVAKMNLYQPNAGLEPRGNRVGSEPLLADSQEDKR